MSIVVLILRIVGLGIAATVGCMVVGLGIATLFDTIDERRNKDEKK